MKKTIEEMTAQELADLIVRNLAKREAARKNRNDVFMRVTEPIVSVRVHGANERNGIRHG